MEPVRTVLDEAELRPVRLVTIGWLTTARDRMPMVVRVDSVGEVFARVDHGRLTF